MSGQRYINRDETWHSDQAKADARALWAVRVLDAYAEAGPRCVPQVEPDRKRCKWSIYVWVGETRLHIELDSIPAARLAAAEAVFPTLPAEVRATLGERP